MEKNSHGDATCYTSVCVPQRSELPTGQIMFGGGLL